MLYKFMLLLSLIALGVSGCQGTGSPPWSPGEATAFVPPTLASPLPASATPEPPAVETPRPTPAPGCTPQLTFLADLSIPDGTVVSPGERLDKRWSVENTGTCNWDQSFMVRLLNGPDMEAPLEQALYPARSGATAVIRIEFTAPSEPGAYRSAWQAVDAQGEPFGDPFYIDIVVSQ